MTDEVRARVFEPFFNTRDGGKGTGLGLATVYGIVRQAGGEVEVTSAPGRGTSFRITLPWSDAAVGPPSGVLPRSGTARSGGPGRAVLLVEDEEALRRFAQAALQRHGYAWRTRPAPRRRWG